MSRRCFLDESAKRACPFPTFQKLLETISDSGNCNGTCRQVIGDAPLYSIKP